MMAQDLEQLVLSISADTRQIQRAMKKFEGDVGKSTRKIERRFDGLGQRINRTFSGIGRGLVAGLAAGVSVRAMKTLSDAATRVDNALKVTGLSGEKLEKVYGRLRDSAMKNGAPIEDLVTLYSRASMAAANLGASQSDLDKFTDNVAMSLRVSGKSAQEASGALLQLSQVLGGSVVQAQEYNSLIDGAYPLLQAVAAGLKEAGGDVGKLTQLVKAGEVPTKAFFDAFQAGAPILEEKVANATFTISQAMGNLQTALIDSVREFNASTGAAADFAGGINNVAKAISDFDISGFIDKITEARGELERFLNDAGNADIFKKLNIAMGVSDAEGNLLNFETEEAKRKAEAMEREVALLQATIEKNTALGFDNTGAISRLGEVSAALAALRGQIAGMPALQSDASGGGRGYELGTPGDPNALARATLGPAKVKTVTLADYAVPASGKKKKGAKERADEYERLTKRINQSTAALQAETAAMLGINPLLDDYGYAVERARLEHELLTAAQEAGKQITPALRAEIAGLADSYASATVEAAKLAEKHDDIRQAAEDLAAFNQDLARGIVDGFLSGASAADVLADSLKKVGNRLLDLAFDSAFSTKGGGIFGSLLGGISGGGAKDPWAGLRGFASGTNYAPGGMALVGEKGPEIVNLPRGSQVIPNHKLGGGANITYSPVIDMRGASVDAVARLEHVLAKDKAEFGARVINTVRQAQKGRHL